MWANGCIKQTNIWLNWKINTGQSASKDPAILPLPASAIKHVWMKTRGSLLSWAKTISEKRNSNCISAGKDFGSFIMVAQLNSDLDENEREWKRQRSNCSCKAGGQTCQQTPSWKAELGSTVQNQTEKASQQWFAAEMLRMKCYLVHSMIAWKKYYFASSKSNQVSNHWCVEVMTNEKKKERLIPTIEINAWITQFDFDLSKFLHQQNYVCWHYVELISKATLKNTNMNLWKAHPPSRTETQRCPKCHVTLESCTVIHMINGCKTECLRTFIA